MLDPEPGASAVDRSSNPNLGLPDDCQEGGGVEIYPAASVHISAGGDFKLTANAGAVKNGANVVVEIDGAERGRAPIHILGAIVCLGRVGASPPLMAFCAEEGVALSFLSETGRFLARVEGPQSGNVLLRRAQHRATADSETALPVARAVVARLPAQWQEKTAPRPSNLKRWK